MSSAVSTMWTSPQRWPADPPGYQFLARALMSLGRAMFSDVWTGTEFSVQTQYLPDRPPFAVPGSLTRRTPSQRAIDPADWQKLVEANRAAIAAQEPLVRRRSEVTSTMIKMLANGDVAAALLDPATGRLAAVAATSWNVPNVARRFAFGAMHPHQLNSYGVEGDGFRKIFVTDASLAAAIAGLGNDLQGDGAWMPGAGETAKAWAARPEVEQEARRRAQAAQVNPTEKAVSRAMEAMWRAAGKQGGSAGTFEQYRLGPRA